jgi:hypothetical protein
VVAERPQAFLEALRAALGSADERFPNDGEEATMSVQDEVDERRRTEAVGHSTNTSDPVQDHACIQAAWQAAAPLWPAWFEVLEAEEATAGRPVRDDALSEVEAVAVITTPQPSAERGVV